jgi:hypothetical protein
MLLLVVGWGGGLGCWGVCDVAAQRGFSARCRKTCCTCDVSWRIFNARQAGLDLARGPIQCFDTAGRRMMHSHVMQVDLARWRRRLLHLPPRGALLLVPRGPPLGFRGALLLLESSPFDSLSNGCSHMPVHVACRASLRTRTPAYPTSAPAFPHPVHYSLHPGPRTLYPPAGSHHARGHTPRVQLGTLCRRRRRVPPSAPCAVVGAVCRRTLAEPSAAAAVAGGGAAAACTSSTGRCSRWAGRGACAAGRTWATT